jgi:hypothetical protein
LIRLLGDEHMTDHHAPPQPEPATRAATLRELGTAYPNLHLGSEQWGTAQIWVAHGRNGHPWLLASDDLAHFRRVLDSSEERS